MKNTLKKFFKKVFTNVQKYIIIKLSNRKDDSNGSS